MKKKHVIFHFLYYVLTMVVYMAFFYAASLMLDLTGKADNLGSVMAVTYGVLFVMTPVLIAILMRFSLFKCNCVIRIISAFNLDFLNAQLNR